MQRYASLKTWKKGLLFLNIVLDSIGWSMILPALPAIHHKLQLSTVAIGYLASTISVVVFLSGAIQGKLTEYVGTLPMLRLSAFAQIVGHMLMLLSLYYQSLFVFVMARCAPALFKSGMVVSQAILYDLTADGSPDDSLRDFGTLFAFSNLAYIIGPVMGGLLYTLSETAPFYFGILTSCLGLVVMWLIEQTGYKGPEANSKAIAGPASPAQTFDDVKPAMGYSLYHMLHLKFAYQVGNTLFESLFAQHCKNMMDLSSANIGYLLGYCGTLSAISNLYILRYFIQRGNTEALLPALIFSLGIGLCIWAVCTSIMWLLCAVSIITIASNLFLSILQNQIAHSQTSQKRENDVLERNDIEFDHASNDVESSVPTLTLRKMSHHEGRSTLANSPLEHRNGSPSKKLEKFDFHTVKTTFLELFSGGSSRGAKGKKSAGVVFGLSSTADRAARIVSPLFGTFFFDWFGPVGLSYMSVLVTAYCLVLLYYNQCSNFARVADIGKLLGVSPKSSLHSFSFSPKNVGKKKQG